MNPTASGVISYATLANYANYGHQYLLGGTPKITKLVYNSDN